MKFYLQNVIVCSAFNFRTELLFFLTELIKCKRKESINFLSSKLLQVILWQLPNECKAQAVDLEDLLDQDKPGSRWPKAEATSLVLLRQVTPVILSLYITQYKFTGMRNFFSGVETWVQDLKYTDFKKKIQSIHYI